MSFQSIKDIFEKVDLDTLVILTYELDDSALFDICLSGSRAIKGMNSVKPVVFFDARKTNETFKAPPTVELIPYHKRGGKHHSKAYLFSSGEEVHLILGSLNLTKSGLLRNREVFKHFVWSKKSTDNIDLLFSFVEFLEINYSVYESHNLSESLHVIKDITEGLSSDVNEYSLIPSGYDTKGLDQITDVWSKESKDSPLSLLSISPFFDVGEKNLIETLNKSLLSTNTIKLISDRGFSKKLPITTAYFDSVSKTSDLSVYELLSIIEPKSHEWNEIYEHEKRLGNKVKDDQEFRRNLHAKIHIWEGREKSLIYFGSANFTLNAWTGKNCELGLVCWHEGSNSNLYSALKQNYLIPDDPAPRESLSEMLEIDDTGEDLLKMKNFPDFILKTELQNISDSHVAFNFTMMDGGSSLGDYIVQWGEDITLKFTDNFSQSFDLKTCLSLFLKRSLKFTHKESKNVYYIPYIFNREITDVVKIHELGGSCEYIEAFLGDSSIDYESELFYEMYGEPLIDETISSGVDRNDNLTIKMQRFTSLLPRLEQRIESLLKEVQASKVLTDSNTKRFLIDPIKEIVSIIEKEYETEKSLASVIYKLGELLLITKQLNAKELVEVDNFITQRFDHYYSPYTGSSGIFKEYKNYVRN